MKVAVASSGRTPDSQLDSRFGRAPVFMVYDTDTGEYKAVDNGMNLNSAQGAGIQTAQNIAATGAQAVIGANFGPKAVLVLQTASIKMYLCQSGTVAEAVEKFSSGELQELTAANVRSHW